ncbi:MAG: esterase [Prevotella sp.]|nr:esterase [Prevotella sp.]
MENEYVKQYPDVMKGKTIMYVHGFGSSAQSGTVGRLREMLPGARVVAEDIPIAPHEGIAMLREMAEREQPDLIVGTSMGGMYAEMLYGFDRIVVNPAFKIADTMQAHGMIGKQTFQNPRKDGVQEFIMTKAMCKEYREVAEQCFTQVTEEEQNRVWGLFGDKDPLVDTFQLFHQHYPKAISFHGEHRMNDKVFVHSVIPVIRWIDDLQEGRERRVVYIAVNALRDEQGQQRSSAMKAYRYLMEHYDVHIVADAPDYDTSYIKEVQDWIKETVNVPAFRHLMFNNHKQLLYGDYLIDPDTHNGAEDFLGTRIELGSDRFKTWEEIIEYFGRLGGQ